jgi:hypothetical protein
MYNIPPFKFRVVYVSWSIGDINKQAPHPTRISMVSTAANDRQGQVVAGTFTCSMKASNTSRNNQSQGNFHKEI